MVFEVQKVTHGINGMLMVKVPLVRKLMNLNFSDHKLNESYALIH